ncbi:hypothetical protein HMPREF7215_1659 [Pyramidobacter piscolens W5455]|uniref:Uncharacterized protein n=1 Tax=Pyramidobacter piscolens W5455 TaxID=352165 RepID=A0ABM9ZSR3_9BACT|nr:hypothetical protein HMPREF7215_1659 [Pyramidobacter piscolens W5455]
MFIFHTPRLHLRIFSLKQRKETQDHENYTLKCKFLSGS